MFKSFGEFIIAVYEQDKFAARYLATECLKKKAGDASLVRKMWNPIVVWKEAFTVINFWNYTASPQGGMYWERLGKDVRDVFYNGEKIREEEEEGMVMPPPAPPGWVYVDDALRVQARKVLKNVRNPLDFRREA